jgi:hypothetical protein
MSDPTVGPADNDTDLEYDLAHEVTSGGAPWSDNTAEAHVMITGTPDSDGDYSYDLAHEIPGR